MTFGSEGDDICTEGIVIGANTVDPAGIPTPVGVQLVRITMVDKKIRILHNKILINTHLFLR